MNKLFYPAIFRKTEEGGFRVTFPDMPECMTQGDNMQHAYDLICYLTKYVQLSRTCEDAAGNNLRDILGRQEDILELT